MSPVSGVRHFHEELARLKSQLLDMSGLAEELVARSMTALRQRDGELAQEVIRRDNDLDAMEVMIDDMCIHLLALQQPMARDLRLITMAMKISNDLERVGDHAVNIAEAVRHLVDQPVYLEFPEIEEMARLATEMLSDALDTFVRADAEGAREVCRRDDRVDGLHNSLFRILLTHMMEDPRRIGASMSLFLVSRNLERIGDLATNIAEDVVFLVEGRNIKHGASLGHGEMRAG
ncbi:MAG TPA: phosphate signaling complex protein PhoU [Longimicrobium sp.]|jgi:phosphate transport system protein|uniref:phosphate signaling complex protein PhoU n=1 Tax=Longimicrobium sp. TaxID=2029185 RepID=UPI002ED8D3EB